MCIRNCIKSRLWPEKLIKDILEKVTNVKENTVPLKIAWACSFIILVFKICSDEKLEVFH